jgi:hypothetical protein
MYSVILKLTQRRGFSERKEVHQRERLKFALGREPSVEIIAAVFPTFREEAILLQFEAAANIPLCLALGRDECKALLDERAAVSFPVETVMPRDRIESAEAVAQGPSVILHVVRCFVGEIELKVDNATAISASSWIR